MGRRRIAKIHYAKSLTHRVLGLRLPAELVDQITEHLTALEVEGMHQLWRAMADRKEHRAARFRLDTLDGTEAEQAAIKELDLMGASTFTSIMAVDGGGDGAQKRYAHLSASKNRPDLAEIVPDFAPSAGPSLVYGDGHLRVDCRPGSAEVICDESVAIYPSSEERRVARLTQVDGIEEAINQWDHEAVERYVKFLGLKVVSTNGEKGGSLTPRLRLLQDILWL